MFGRRTCCGAQGGGGETADSAPARPPPFNLDDDALAVFSMAYFRPDEDMERERQKSLRGKSVRDVFHKFITKSRREGMCEAQEGLSAAIGVDSELIEGYCAVADMSARLWLAATLFKAKHLCEFKEVTLVVGSALDPLLLPDELLPLAGAHPRTLDLSLLAPLRMAGESDPFFAAGPLFVRNGMRTIFDLFRDDVVEANMAPGSRSAVLVGSPGVGTSTLAFLAALFQAQTRTVVYYRITESRGEKPCVFVMAPAGGSGEKGEVRVWFSRSLDERSLESLRRPSKS